ncbi:MAG: hypothetical protein ACKVHE_27820, partial [Planctomycetales bacterium]
VDAAEAQQWKATLLFSCKPQDVGCRFKIVCGNSTSEFVVAEGHDLAFSQSQERVPPSPHYAVCNWRELTGGNLFRSHGRQEIWIICVNRPGANFAEIKARRLEPSRNASHR